jgi:3-methyladenine DNA glycosylase AlkC
MTEPFKTFLNAPLVRTMAAYLERAWPPFDARAFTQRATQGLDALELEARAPQLKPFIADPSPTLPLLQALQDDPSACVRRSVANHLNDIAKDHATLVSDWVETHLPHASAQRRALLEHASRALIKQGHARTLAAWGLGARFRGRAALTVAPDAIALGEHVTLELTLTSTARAAQTLAVDYVVHHVRADGRSSPRVFKGWTCTLDAGAARTLTRRHAMRPITTRRYYAGVHRVEVQVNETVVADDAFALTLP